MNRIKHCPVCGELVAVYQGSPDKYGDKAVWNYFRFIRLKYDCDECRDMMKGQSTRLSNRRRRAERRDERTALLDVLDAFREEVRLSRQRIAELEAARRC